MKSIIQLLKFLLLSVGYNSLFYLNSLKISAFSYLKMLCVFFIWVASNSNRFCTYLYVNLQCSSKYLKCCANKYQYCFILFLSQNNQFITEGFIILNHSVRKFVKFSCDSGFNRWEHFVWHKVTIADCLLIFLATAFVMFNPNINISQKHLLV